MLQLTKDDIHLNQEADTKENAIKKIAHALTQNQFVEEGYIDGMLERESQAATYLGSGIAIPHGTTKTRHLVKKTGVQVFCFPQGVAWGDDGEKAYIAIGIAASSDEHLSLLRQLTHVLGDEDVESRIKQIRTKDDAIALLTGKEATTSNEVIFDSSALDVQADSLATLQALNGARLKHLKVVNSEFLLNVLDNQPSYLGQGVWLSDSKEGNLKNAVVVSRASSNILESDRPVKLLITVSAKNEGIDPVIEKLAHLSFSQQFALLLTANSEQIVQTLTSQNIAQVATAQPEAVSEKNNNSDILTREFIVLNPHGLHTRPSSVLVKLVKEFNSKITVANLDGTGAFVSATSLMKIVALGAKKGSRIAFTAEGDDAQQALDAIAKAVAEGFGEGTA